MKEMTPASCTISPSSTVQYQACRAFGSLVCSTMCEILIGVAMSVSSFRRFVGGVLARLVRALRIEPGVGRGLVGEYFHRAVDARGREAVRGFLERLVAADDDRDRPDLALLGALGHHCGEHSDL